MISHPALQSQGSDNSPESVSALDLRPRDLCQTFAGVNFVVNVTETGAVDFSRFAVTFNASSATPGRTSTISVALTPPQPADGSNSGSDESSSVAAVAPASVLLLFTHTVPDGADGRLELLLSGAVCAAVRGHRSQRNHAAGAGRPCVSAGGAG